MVLWRLVLLAGFVALVWLRMPGIMRHGRFWAEEGQLYFVNAATLPWWRALSISELGYLNLPANAATLCARYLVRLENAPHVTTAIALCLQSLPALVLLSARDAWLRRPAVLAAGMLLLAVPPYGDEVWLNTITSQFHIALAAALCLALEAPSVMALEAPGVMALEAPGVMTLNAWGVMAASARLLLVTMAPLCSPICAALAPLFMARAMLERSRQRLLQACGVVAGTAVQFCLFYHATPGRGQMPHPSIVVSMIAARHLALPLLGHELAAVLAGDLRHSILQARRPYLAIVLVTAACLGLGGAAWLRRQPAVLWMLGAALALGAISTYAALGPRIDLISVDGGMRYAYAPLMLTSLAVLAIAATGTDRLAAIFTLLTVWLLAVGLIQATLPYSDGLADGPRWRAEVARWRADPTYALAIWPGGWTLHLR